ncbi:9313_t:CDS:2 [Funneliformis mosseae]|uniref:9313_t:CDS:1 n=1 Tax=Funneliformis mosseae TaxID=27381 RepID=A0A9N9APP7_FUNMO|nr:9313_t:CDS:2 [Funneliformis mosseae]
MWTPFNIIMMWLFRIFMTRVIWNIEAIPFDQNDFHSTQLRFQINEINNKEFSGKFLHITDLHLDPYYLTNSKPKKYCHRYAKKSKNNISGKFGTLGSNCDSPYALLDSAFSFLKDNLHDADFVIYTGDSLRHDRDSKIPFSKDDVISGHKTVVQYVTETFDLSKTKFIPTLGNNDEWEHNQLEGGPNTLFGNLTQIWTPLNLNLTSDFTNGGYFRQDINSKLSVFSLNSMFFYESNDQIKDCDNKKSPGAIQLEWLKNQLKNARREKRRVLIAQHVPPLDSDGESSFLPQCEDEFVQLLGEFSDIISGHFTGHTNLDTLTFLTESENVNGKYSLYYLDKDEGPSKKSFDNIILVLNNAPSIVPGKYSTSSETFGALSDYIQYYLDIEKANEIGKSEWEVEYIASETYNMKQLSPSEWANVLNEMESEHSESWQNYLKFITVSSE